MTQWVGAPHCMSPPCQDQRHCGSGNVFNLPCDLTRSRYLRAMRLYRKEPLKESYHPTKFGGHRHHGSGDILVLVCHVILLDHVING